MNHMREHYEKGWHTCQRCRRYVRGAIQTLEHGKWIWVCRVWAECRASLEVARTPAPPPKVDVYAEFQNSQRAPTPATDSLGDHEAKPKRPRSRRKR